MPNINLPNINISENDLKSEETMKQLVDTLFKYKKELNYLLSNLDADNMPAVIKRVSKTEEDTEGLVTRVSAAELAITPEAITSIVESNTTELAKKSDIPDPVDTSLLATKSEVTQTATSVRLEFTTLKDENGVDTTIESGVTRINKNGIRVTHNGTNQYSEMRADGFVRKWQYGEARYLNDIYVITGLATDNERTSPVSLSFPLPERFKNRDNIEAILVPKDFVTGYFSNIRSDGTVKYTLDMIDLWTSCTVTTGLSPSVSVTAYFYYELVKPGNDLDSAYYRDVGFDLIVVGY